VKDRLAFAVCAAMALAALWIPKYLPMTDLPQHAAQVSIWQHLSDARFGFARQFELHWSSPYLVGYVLTRGLAGLFGVGVALKIVITAAVLAFPLALDRLLAAAGGDRRLAIVGFPLAFGFVFYWGFLNFLVALPLGVLFLAHAYRYADRPSVGGAVILAVSAVGLYVCHVLVMALTVACAGLVIVGRAGSFRAAALRALPLLAPVPFAIVWMARMQSGEELVHIPMVWRIGWKRFVELPGTILGHRDDVAAAIVALLFLVALALAGLRPRKGFASWAPGALGLAAFLIAPYRAFGTFHIYPRFAVFVVPLMLAGATPPSSPQPGRRGRILLTALAVAWLGVLTFRFHTFDADARQFDILKERMAPNRRVLALMFDPTSNGLPGAPFLHFPAWYQAEKGGVLGFSFATFFPELARYQPGAAPQMSPGLEWFPQLFDWSIDGDYDYFVIRSAEDVGPRLFARATVPVVLETRVGAWWLYARRPLP
jgi:hypothetical protein